ncbi:MAG: hypothetical protein ACXADF_18300 [Candidatus Thorarchaeota archaeon]
MNENKMETPDYLCISICTATSSATVIWSDYFDDGIPDGWTIFGYENQASQVIIPGNISAENFMLEVLDDDFNVARHDSDTNVGTWSFDLFVPHENDGEGWVYVNIMSNGTRPAPAYPAMRVTIGAWISEGRLVIWSYYGYESEIHHHFLGYPMEGWHHIAVSRSSEGRFLVAINGTLKANYTSNAVTSSTYLEFSCKNATGATLDNLVVDDDPNEFWNHVDLTNTTPTTPTTTTPTTPTPPLPIDPTLLLMVGGAAVVVIVLAIVFLRRSFSVGANS